jgi:hypothetical protein
MAIEIRETFQVQAPIDAVWRFVMDPQQVVTAMPGATLEQVVDERTFLGAVRVKVGAISANYKGRVQFTEIDPSGYGVRLAAEGRETGGGMAKGTMASRLRELPGGGTEVIAEASLDLTGRLMQVGRGMIQGVAHQLFQQFVTSMQQRLEVAATTTDAAAAIAPPPSAPAQAKAIRVLPLLFRALVAAVTRFFRRLFSARAAVPPSS